MKLVTNVVALAALLTLAAGCSPEGGGSGTSSSSSGGSTSKGGTVLVANDSGAPKNSSPPSAAPAASAVKLDIKDYDELVKLIGSKKGKVVVVDFWSTHCDPCMAEFPGLVALHKKHGPEKIACISVCANYVGLGKIEDEVAAPLEFLKSQGAEFDNILSKDADDVLYGKIKANHGVKIASVPMILVFDQEGKQVKAFENEVTYKEVGEVVEPLLK